MTSEKNKAVEAATYEQGRQDKTKGESTMGIYVPHLISAIHDTLTRLAVNLHKPNLVSPTSLNLLCGVAAVESNSGYFNRQHPLGPALGIFQMEPTTADDILRYLSERDVDGVDKSMRLAVEDATYARIPPKFSDWRFLLTTNLSVATAFARIKFAMVEAPLPDASDIFGLANYWKKHYNTFDGKGNPDEFVAKFNLHFEQHLRSYVGT